MQKSTIWGLFPDLAAEDPFIKYFVYENKPILKIEQLEKELGLNLKPLSSEFAYGQIEGDNFICQAPDKDTVIFSRININYDLVRRKKEADEIKAIKDLLAENARWYYIESDANGNEAIYAVIWMYHRFHYDPVLCRGSLILRPVCLQTETQWCQNAKAANQA